MIISVTKFHIKTSVTQLRLENWYRKTGSPNWLTVIFNHRNILIWSFPELIDSDWIVLLRFCCTLKICRELGACRASSQHGFPPVGDIIYYYYIIIYYYIPVGDVWYGCWLVQPDLDSSFCCKGTVRCVWTFHHNCVGDHGPAPTS